MDNTARLRNFNKEVYCIENNVLIFVSNFKRGSITFETPIQHITVNKEGTVYLLLEDNKIVEVKQDSD